MEIKQWSLIKYQPGFENDRNNIQNIMMQRN